MKLALETTGGDWWVDIPPRGVLKIDCPDEGMFRFGIYEEDGSPQHVVRISSTQPGTGIDTIAVTSTGVQPKLDEYIVSPGTNMRWLNLLDESVTLVISTPGANPVA